jgi:dinuclear metal center YbgI/SA1388 family protein
MRELAEIEEWLNRELNTSAIEDYPGAVNGLQLANSGKIRRIISAVDASQAVIEAAAQSGSGLLIVHHGMFWQGVQAVTGAFYRKLKIAMEADLAIYSSHLPLDIHPELGNNILLAQALHMQQPEPFLDQKGRIVGIRGTWTGSRSALLDALESALNGRVHHCPGGPETIRQVVIITGAAGGQIAKIAASGADTFITGEGPHWSFPLAEELGMNLFYGGHYATETFGVRALAELLSKRYEIPTSFIDHPTGL